MRGTRCVKKRYRFVKHRLCHYAKRRPSSTTPNAGVARRQSTRDLFVGSDPGA